MHTPFILIVFNTFHVVTKTFGAAQETIAVAEYMRALRLKTQPEHAAHAERLFRDLLSTAVIAEARKACKKESRLCHVKYSCLKNIGLICCARGDDEDAFEHLAQAFDLDDGDVPTMCRLGRLAMSTQRHEFALRVYERCLQQNANYWPAVDGILRVLFEREDYAEAYGWALQWYERNADYARALDVIVEVRERFGVGTGREYIEQMWRLKFDERQAPLKTTVDKPKVSCFPKYELREAMTIERPDLVGSGLEKGIAATWQTVGELIVRMYERFVGTEALAWEWNLDEFLSGEKAMKREQSLVDVDMNKEVVSVEQADAIMQDQTNVKDLVTDKLTEIARKYSTESSSNGCETAAMLLNDDAGSKDSTSSGLNTGNPEIATSDANAGGPVAADCTGDGIEATSARAAPAKPKASRRRGGGDLLALEQWGWHKNKRYSQRKKSLDRQEADTTIRGLLRKVLARFYE